MKGPLKDEICPMFNEPCRFCSIEKASGQYTICKREPLTGFLIGIGMAHGTLILGAYCSNIGKWVEDMHYCPKKWSKSQSVLRQEEQKWKVDKNSDIKKTQRIVKCGQQTLISMPSIK